MLRNVETLPLRLVDLAIRRPRTVLVFVAVVTVLLGAAILKVQVDTDPENMLPGDNDVRVLNDSLKQEFGIGPAIALGLVDEGGVLDAEHLEAASALVADIEQVPHVLPGIVSFRLAASLPEAAWTAADVEALKAALRANPALADRVASSDGTGLAIYIPLDSKDAAHGVAQAVETLTQEHSVGPGTTYYLGGLPLAEDAFGEDMFVQMFLLAPLAGLLIFLLMLFFFRSLTLVLVAMAIAMVSVTWTMGLLVASGNVLHIMSSMIPIFLMPIAILDSIHVLSETFERYRDVGDKRVAIQMAYSDLVAPLAFTSITTIVAFASLALAPIPPVQVFGIFIAIGVGLAWLLTLTMIPAAVVLLSEERLAKMTASGEAGNRLLVLGVRAIGRLPRWQPAILTFALAIVAVAMAPGLGAIEVNDNPVRWFKSDNSVRQATEEFSARFSGAFQASVIVSADAPGGLAEPETAAAIAGLQDLWAGLGVVGTTTSYVDMLGEGADTPIPGSSQEIVGALTVAAAAPAGILVPTLIDEARSRANVQLLLRSGDNQSMKQVVDATEAYLVTNPLPPGVTSNWAGETYLNLVWQDRMVNGMFKAFASTFVVILVLMWVLFRSLRWALLAMLPMSATVLAVYGVLGYVGKDYDMPLAVLSTLVLGIGVDFAIHFIERYRALRRSASADEAMRGMYEEPGRAITRNALVIGIGFVPLLFSSLVPYIVVGVLLSSIMVLTWLGTMIGLPSVIMLAARAQRSVPEPVVAEI